MAFLEKDVVIKIEDGEVVFHDLGLRTWAALTEVEKSDSLEDQARAIFKHIKAINNIFFSENDPVTPASLLDPERDIPVAFFTKLKGAWIDQATKRFSELGSSSKNG